MAAGIKVGSLPGKPAAFFVVPDPVQPLVVSATQEAGPYPGAVSGGGFGHLAPAQVGDNLASGVAASYEYTIARAGGTGKAEFAFRRAGDVSFSGKDDPRLWAGYHTPGGMSQLSNSCAYVPNTRTLVALSGSVSTVNVYTRDVDTTRYDQWTTHGWSMTGTNRQMSANGHDAQLIDLPDGSLMLVARCIWGAGALAAPDFCIWHCADPTTASWTLVARDIMQTQMGYATPIVMPSASMFRVARAGEWIRLVFCDNATPGLLHTVCSRDRGMTWQYLDAGTTVRSNAAADADDIVPFDIVGVDDSGTFILAAVAVATATIAQFYTASGTSAWTVSTTTRTTTSAVKAVVLGRGGSHVYSWLCWSDRPAAAAVDGWDMGRALLSQYNDFANASGSGWEWLNAGTMNTVSGQEWHPGRVKAIMAGPSWFFCACVKNEATGTEQTGYLAWYADRWSIYNLGRQGPSVSLAAATTPLWNMRWVTAQGRPTDGSGTAWTTTVVGAGTDTITPDNLLIQGTTTGDTKYYEIAAGGTAGRQYTYGGIWRFMVRLDTGDGSAAADNVAVRIIMADAAGTNRRDVSLRFDPTSITAFDNVAGATMGTMTGLTLDTGSAGAFHEVFFALSSAGASASIYAYNHGTKVWTNTVVSAATSGAAAATSLIRWGHLGQAQATQMRSWWREVDFSNDSWNGKPMGGLPSAGSVPADATASVLVPLYTQMGALCTSAPTYIEQGLSVSWGGVGAGEGDAFVGVVAYNFPRENVFWDSPRVPWRSTSVANCAIIARSGGTANHRWRHDAVAVFGCNNRFILVDYDNNTAFSSPTATETIDLTAFDTGTTPLTVSAVDGNTMTFTGTSFRFVAGELVGYFVRMTNGPAVGLTYRVTRHPADGIVQFDGEATAITAAAGNTLVIFASHGAKKFASAYSDNYVRVRAEDTDTADGFHQIGTVVLGRSLDVTVPMDWAHTDDEQPNLTQYRTRSGVAWAFAEGPPQRTITGRVVGDAERWRERFRYLLRQIDYEGKACALVIDALRIPETVLLGRVRSGSALDNAAWYQDAFTKARTAGDLSLTFVEEPG